MLDLELLSKPTYLPRVLLYKYRSGVMRSRVIDWLQAAARKAGLDAYACGQDALFGPSLFDGVLLFDCAELRTVQAADLSVCLREVANSSSATVIFAEVGTGQCECLNWAEADPEAVVVEERQITSETVEAALKYFVGASDLVVDRRILGDGAFTGHFRTFVDRPGGVDVSEFSREFDTVILRWMDHETGQFTIPDREKGTTVQRAERLRPLRAYVLDRHRSDFIDFLQGLEHQRRSGASTARLVSTLLESSIALIEKPGGLGPSRCMSGALLWGAAVLCWRRRLSQTAFPAGSGRIEVDRFFCQLDQIARMFEACCADEAPRRLLFGQIREALSVLSEKDQLGCRLRQVLQEALASACPGGPDWIGTLQAFLDPASSPSGAVLVEPPTFRAPVLARAMRDIVGHQEVIQALQARFRTVNHSTPIWLYGPPGIGKRTIASVYARSLLCERISYDRLVPCGECAGCRGFDLAGGFGYSPLNLAAPNALAYVREYLAGIQSHPFAEHRVVVVERPESAPGIVDTFLKTLEAQLRSTTVIFLTRSLEGARGAGLSRSQVFALKPLTADKARELLAWFFEELRVSCQDEGIVDLLAAAGGGIPGRLYAAVQQIGAAQWGTIAEAKQALGLGWGQEALTRCRDLIGANRTARREAVVLDRDMKEYLQSALVELWRMEIGAPNPISGAFISSEPDLSITYEMLRAEADRQGCTSIELLEAISNRIV
ncbi:hypothetical protein [Rhodoplanes roseus]|uniref:Uncharacterized protein n=2 Tax=Rhodoplanes TaxID=29407 RepID=A0A327L628_9BRAD|nr:hypothetical protein [Rhodoplanes roseus]RAI45333.1 hypothetical protein CH341_04465 [Rhodoplanes roseus]